MNAEGDQRVREIEARYREKERRGKVALAIMFAGFIVAARRAWLPRLPGVHRPGVHL